MEQLELFVPNLENTSYELPKDADNVSITWYAPDDKLTIKYMRHTNAN